jgi:hypothetical protein
VPVFKIILETQELDTWGTQLLSVMEGITFWSVK